MTPMLETERLLLVPLRQEDAEQVQRIFPRWEIVRYLNGNVPWPFPANGVSTFYREVELPAMARGDAWSWTLRRKTEPGRIVGALSLYRSREVSRGFWLVPEEQGRGLMTEAVATTNDFWFGVLGFATLQAHRAVANEASRRIAERTGMRLIATCEADYVSGRLPTEAWEITAEQWRMRRPELGTTCK